MQALFLRSVALAALAAACSTPTRDKPTAPAAPEPARPATREPVATTATERPAPEPSAAPSVAVDVEQTDSALPTSPTGSAYFGCGVAVPPDRLWDETTETQVLEAISSAKKCAAEQGRRLLLEFVAPWCGDCREMARLEGTPLVDDVMRARFERVRINVGKWDRHETLRENYAVKALATYIVIDPKTSQQLAKTTLEPITKKHGKKLTAEDWAAWLRAH